MLWGGRFKDKLDQAAMKFSSSLSFDKNLTLEDIQGSRAHAKMLCSIGILTAGELAQISNGLAQIEAEWSQGSWNPDENVFEDIHSAIEARLGEIIGATAGKLHTGRSRNDQIATAMRLWIMKACREVVSNIQLFQSSLVELASAHTRTLIPGYTHLQRAQPVSFAFHLLAYVEMLERDKNRFEFALAGANKLPLGSGALAGSTLPLDRHLTTELLGFEEPCRNALDAVSDRDFLLDFLNACSTGMMHLSRLAEEIVLWSTSEWKFIRLSDKYSTGSSLMPQKKNPDMAELTRGKSGRVFGNQVSLLATLKGLPLSYNRDLQEDKEPVFDSYETYLHSLLLAGKMVETMEVNTARFPGELKGDFSLATDLADWLVMKGIPFREAHKIVGELVKYAENKAVNFENISVEEMKTINPVFDASALECLNISSALERKKTFGSPNPALVEEQVNFWKKKLNR
ncbi:MAG: argininosuccinate lyase [Ignavibacteria bacterium]|jgi:argininosuccinate lyase|nr:argininosuccinate lyase [Ignavibacteria bacterium]MCU7502668.1 argininosuccinate lyase [Ignavibacteria bacterium]MCU7515129.1 argininosuccinate lyase [Ignavibacteria bacterium]